MCTRQGTVNWWIQQGWARFSWFWTDSHPQRTTAMFIIYERMLLSTRFCGAGMCKDLQLPALVQLRCWDFNGLGMKPNLDHWRAEPSGRGLAPVGAIKKPLLH